MISTMMELSDRLKTLARAAADEVEPDMVVGLGSGSTSDAVVRELGRRVGEGLRFTGVATSERTAALASSFGIPLRTMDDVETLDLCLDGADEIDPALNLVKGRGGALLWEKVVAARARRFVVVAASEKLVPQLGVRMPLPVEVIPFGLHHTARALSALAIAPVLRRGEAGTPFLTDGGHYILDCVTGPMADCVDLATRIKALTGVVDHGLFIGMANRSMTVDLHGEITTIDRQPDAWATNGN